MYTVNPASPKQFKYDAIEAADMGGQLIGQIALAYVTGGSSLSPELISQLSTKAALPLVAKELAVTTAPIAAAYAVGNANATYNETMNTAEDMASKEAMQ
jgi:hypothetical protein